MQIRKYNPSDRPAVEFIHFKTGFIGASMSKWLSNNHLWKKKIAYYLENEPESIFLLEDRGKVVGYLLGCLDDRKYNSALGFVIENSVNLLRSFSMPKKDRAYWVSQFMIASSILFGKSEELKLKIPKGAGHIHINLLPEARRKGWGTKMVAEFARYARKKGVKKVHAESFGAQNFWLKNGFKEFSRVKTGIWEKQLPRDVYVSCYVKEL
jgi:ribosomal protein S18 acetylase RimI-like enzyme